MHVCQHHLYNYSPLTSLVDPYPNFFLQVYGNTLLVNHTHKDVDRMFENLSKHLRRADMLTPACHLRLSVHTCFHYMSLKAVAGVDKPKTFT